MSDIDPNYPQQSHLRGYKAPAATWMAEDPVLDDGAIGQEIETGRVKVGDGATAWSGLGFLGAAGSGTSVAGWMGPYTINAATADLTALGTTGISLGAMPEGLWVTDLLWRGPGFNTESCLAAIGDGDDLNFLEIVLTGNSGWALIAPGPNLEALSIDTDQLVTDSGAWTIATGNHMGASLLTLLNSTQSESYWQDMLIPSAKNLVVAITDSAGDPVVSTAGTVSFYIKVAPTVAVPA